MISESSTAARAARGKYDITLLSVCVCVCVCCVSTSVGHKGKFGHEFLEFEFRSEGRLRYANNSNYKNDTMIRKEGTHADIWPLSVVRQTGTPAA